MLALIASSQGGPIGIVPPDQPNFYPRATIYGEALQGALSPGINLRALQKNLQPQRATPFEDVLVSLCHKLGSIQLLIGQGDGATLEVHVSIDRNRRVTFSRQLATKFERSGSILRMNKVEAKNEVMNVLRDAVAAERVWLPLRLPNILTVPREVNLFAWPGDSRYLFARMTSQLVEQRPQQQNFWYQFFVRPSQEYTSVPSIGFAVDGELVVAQIDQYSSYNPGWKGELSVIHTPSFRGIHKDRCEQTLDQLLKDRDIPNSGVYLAIPNPEQPPDLQLVQARWL